MFIPYIPKKTSRVVIRNIHHITDTFQISSTFAEIDFTVKHVTNIKHYQTKTFLTLFFVDLALKILSKKVFNIIFLINIKTKIEESNITSNSLISKFPDTLGAIHLAIYN